MQEANQSNPSHLHAYSMSFVRYVLLALIVLGSTFGDVYIAKGMKQIGEMSLRRWHDLLFAPLHPYVALGTVLLMIFYLSYLASLSWADLSYIMPATTFGYVLTALSAHFMLGESVPLTRWIGIIMITLGVGFITGGPSLTVAPTPEGISPHIKAPS
ncbi:MAG: EamA family transporter [Terriglobales bacterium]|jgi:drug/metabolite transporter (DMT)-like permease